MQHTMNVLDTVQQGHRRRARQLVVPLKSAALLALTWGGLYPVLLWSLSQVF